MFDKCCPKQQLERAITSSLVQIEAAFVLNGISSQGLSHWQDPWESIEKVLARSILLRFGAFRATNRSKKRENRCEILLKNETNIGGYHSDSYFIDSILISLLELISDRERMAFQRTRLDRIVYDEKTLTQCKDGSEDSSAEILRAASPNKAVLII